MIHFYIERRNPMPYRPTVNAPSASVPRPASASSRPRASSSPTAATARRRSPRSPRGPGSRPAPCIATSRRRPTCSPRSSASVSQREVDAARAPRTAAGAPEHGHRAAAGRDRDVRPPRPARPPSGVGAAGRARRPRGRGRAARVPPRPRRRTSPRSSRAGIARGELPEQDADVVGAALVGALGEALVGPLSPVAPRTRPRRAHRHARRLLPALRHRAGRRDVHARP